MILNRNTSCESRSKANRLGRILRRIMAAFIVLPIIMIIIANKVVPYEETLKYTDGKFYMHTSLDIFNDILVGMLIAVTLLTMVLVITCFMEKQSFGRKIGMLAASLALWCCCGISIMFAQAINSIFDDWKTPTYLTESRINGEILVLANEPEGMHHSSYVIFKIEGDEPVRLGSGQLESGISAEYYIETTADGYIAKCVEKGHIKDSFEIKSE